MSFVHTANTDEAAVLRTIFGPDVTEVDFRDSEEGHGRYIAFEAFDTAGNPIGTVDGSRNTRHSRLLHDIAADRDQTVRFWLHL